MADLPQVGENPLPDTERLVQQAIDSVLHSSPEPVATPGPDEAKSQPWAETAAPPGKNKRPLEELLEEYARRVAASPGALAATPGDRRPSESFFERLTRRDGDVARPGRGRRGRQRSGRGRGQPEQVPRRPAEGGSPRGPGRPAQGSRRSPRGSGGTPRGAGPPQQGSERPPRQAPVPPRDSGTPGQGDGSSAGRRRRGRRRRR